MNQTSDTNKPNGKIPCMRATRRPGPASSLRLSARLRRWWQAQTPQDRYRFLGRSSLSIVCFGAIVFGMPMLSHLGVKRQDEAQFRARNMQLARVQDAGEVVRRTGGTPALFEHDWLQHIEYSLERDPGRALGRYSAMERDRAAIDSLTDRNRPDLVRIGEAGDIVRQTWCMAVAIYYEAGSERTEGQIAVGEVIMNRVRDHRYPNTVCDVVFQGATRTTGCQFTFTCDGAMKRKPVGGRWQKAQTIAQHVMMNLNEVKTGGATHYHAVYVNPVWNSGLIRTGRIGLHIFYRFPRGREWSIASARQNRRLAQNRARHAARRDNVAKIAVNAAHGTDGNLTVSDEGEGKIITASAHQPLPGGDPAPFVGQ